MNFRDTKPPATIVVTRSEGENGPLSRVFRDADQKVLNWQVAFITEPSDPEPLRRALARLVMYDWIVLSSGAAVDVVTHYVDKPPPDLRVAAVGTATAGRLRRAGWPVDAVPTVAGARYMAEAMLEQNRNIHRVLFPASATALPTLPRELNKAGVDVDQVEAYRLIDSTGPTDEWIAELEAGKVNAVTFTSPSAVTSLRKVLGDETFVKLGELVVTAIGATTAEAVRVNGLTVTDVAKPSSLESLAKVTLAALDAKVDVIPSAGKS